MKRVGGFTLLELLVSLAIFTVIFTVAYGTLSNILSGSEALSTEQRRWQRLDTAFQLMQEDLAFASARRIRDIDGRTLPAMTGQPTDIRAVSKPSLEFTRIGLGALAGSRETGSRRIAWRMRDNAVFREIWPTLDRTPVAIPTSARLLAGVEAFEVRFLDQAGQWHASWPDNQAAEQALPVAIEVTISPEKELTLKRVFLVNG